MAHVDRLGSLTMLPKYQGKPVSSIVRLKFRDWKRRATRPLHTASFYRRLDYRRQYIRGIAAEYGRDSEVFPEYAKSRGRSVAVAAGVDVPKLLAGPIPLGELNLDEYGDNFVIKPDWGTSSRGVLVLRKVDRDSFRELISGKVLHRDEIRPAILEGMAITRRDSSDRILVEESIANGDLRPQEWKVFAFHGRVGLVQQMDRNADQTRMKFYSSTGEPLGRLRSDIVFAPELVPSPVFAEIIEAAEAISAAIPTGFVRVDLFEQEGGRILLGELCMGPGGDLLFKKGWDRKLGRMWDDADRRLIAKREPLIP